jgi:N-acetylmuramoyl-L-alanine amidase
MKTIYIHQGHRQSDPGAEAPDGYKESDYTKTVGEKLATKLREAGYTVYLSRERLPDAESPEVAKDANAVNADFVISIHANSADATSARGAEIFITGLSQKARDVATAIEERFRAMFPNRPWRGVKLQSQSAHSTIAILTKTRAPAALIEGGFLSNADELVWLKSKDGQDGVAGVLSAAITSCVRKDTAYRRTRLTGTRPNRISADPSR